MKSSFVSSVKSWKSRCALGGMWAVLFGYAAMAQEIAPQRMEAAQPLITQAVDETQLTVLKGNTHPLARPEFDLGTAPATLPMERMLLVLKRSADQETALRALLDNQQDKHSASYHKWLTPEQYGQQYGPTDADMQTITGWLQSHGFQVGTTKGRTVLEFSGSASQVQEAFHTTIHKYIVNGEQHWANANDPSIPTALTPAVAGVLTLHNFLKRPQIKLSNEKFRAKMANGAKPQFTGSDNSHALVPGDFYTIYNTGGYVGGAGSIALVGRSNINLQDVTYFHYWTDDQAESPNVFANGTDPGDLGGSEEAEAVLDTTWAGAVAPSSFVTLVVSASTNTTDGADLSEAYIIDNNFSDVMSESFGDCETGYSSSGAASISALAQQAAAEGITYLVASGDSGSAGCDDPNTETIATQGLAVNILASTPFTTAVGGTVFNENGHESTYWQATNQTGTLASALSYIPEDVWNDSCTSATCPTGITANIWAGGGGKSVFFTRASWQAGVAGIPAGTARAVPDVSLSAASHDPYLLCLDGSCVPNAQGEISFWAASGTSASTPSFAGILAIVAGTTGSRLGIPGYVLYRLAAAENLAQCNASSGTLPAGSCVFNDVTVGNNAVPGEANYGTASATYPSSSGYDLATGLGSVNVKNLINQWKTVTFSPTTTTFTITPTSAVHGDAFSVSGTVTPNSGTGMPSGTVWLNEIGRGNLIGDGTLDLFSLTGQGSYSGVTHLLPGGTYQVNAHYAGDGTYGGSDSSPSVQVTIQPESTTTTFSVLTTNASGSLIPFSSGPYGTPVYYQAHVSGQSGYGTPTAYVNFWDTGGWSTSSGLDANGNVMTPALQVTAGPHSITAGYYGDNSFSPSDDLTPINFTISKVATNTTLSSQQTAQSLLLTAKVAASGTGSPATGVVTFSSGTTVLGTSALNQGSTSNGTTQAAATYNGSQLAPGQYNVTASYPGDTNYTASSSSAVSLNLVADFSIANQGITSETVTAGATASYINDIVLTPFFGFSSTVTVSCTVPATDTSCSVTPDSYALASGTGIGTLSVKTQARSSASSGPLVDQPWFRRSIWLLPTVASLLCAMTLFWAAPRRFRLVGASVLLILSSGCGGNGGTGSTGGGSPPPTTGTPAGTYTVTVTATAASLTHTTTLTLVVQ